MDFDARFGPPPPRNNKPRLLCTQFLVACVILLAVRPPFVCDASGTVRVSTTFTVAALSTVCCVLLNASNISPVDVFRGAM